MEPRAWWSSVAVAAAFAIATGSGACEADLEDDCTAGPCGGATVAAAATASAGSAGGGDSACVFPDTKEIPCDVYTVLAARCHRCHQDPTLNGAPFPLLTWENFQFIYPDPPVASSKPVWQRADVAIEPDALPRMPDGEDPLPEDQRAILHAWFATCEAGECEKAPLPDGSGGAGGAGTGGDGGTGGAAGAGGDGGGTGGDGGA